MGKIKDKDWKWFGDPGHFICAKDCEFHLCTQVGSYLVSTVGKLWSEQSSRKIHASVYDPKWLAQNQHLRGDDFDFAYKKKFGYGDIGCDRKFETMVFKAGKLCEAKECGCGLPEIDGSELDFSAYNNSKDANAGHLGLCLKWASASAALNPKTRTAKG